MHVGIDNRATPHPPRLTKSLCLLRANKQSILCLVCSPIRDFFANNTARSCHRGRGGDFQNFASRGENWHPFLHLRRPCRSKQKGGRRTCLQAREWLSRNDVEHKPLSHPTA